MDFSIGCDPELFVVQQGTVVSAHEYIKGNKEEPFVVDCGATQKDGVAAEFNIDPVSSEYDWLYNIHTVMESLKGMIPEEAELIAQPVAKFDPKYLFSLPDEVLELGCDPDFNAYTGMCNPRPDANRSFRTGAGHVHVGWGYDIEASAEHFALCREIIKQLDVYLGVPSILYDDDTQRRELYGAAGAFRPKSYGVEYRTLSNKWLASDTLTSWVYRNTMRAVEDFLIGIKPYEHYDVQSIINTSDIDAAFELLRKEGIDYEL